MIIRLLMKLKSRKPANLDLASAPDLQWGKEGIMKRRWDWLSDLLGVGMPMMLGISGPLPGPQASPKKLSGPLAQQQLIKASAALDSAEQALAKKQWAQAKEALIEADQLIERVQTNTLRFTEISDRKRRLWMRLDEEQNRQRGQPSAYEKAIGTLRRIMRPK